ncbi:MAG: flagellar export protein FliJ [Phycisphaerales bacterium JB037]
MKPFRFELEAVLRQRSRLEDERAGELARRRRAHAAVLEEIDKLDAEIAARLADRREWLGEGVVDVRAAAQDAAAVGALRRERDRAVARADQAERDAESARQALAQASVERKAVESLRVKRYEAWRREWARREQLELDDLAQSRRAGAGARVGAGTGEGGAA